MPPSSDPYDAAGRDGDGQPLLPRDRPGPCAGRARRRPASTSRGGDGSRDPRSTTRSRRVVRREERRRLDAAVDRVGIVRAARHDLPDVLERCARDSGKRTSGVSGRSRSVRSRRSRRAPPPSACSRAPPRSADGRRGRRRRRRRRRIREVRPAPLQVRRFASEPKRKSPSSCPRDQASPRRAVRERQPCVWPAYKRVYGKRRRQVPGSASQRPRPPRPPPHDPPPSRR